MLRILSSKHTAFPWLILLLLSVSLACKTLTGGLPADSGPVKWTTEVEKDFGPGSFDFPDPKAGLSDLSSYTATLSITFDGTRDGNAEKWSKTYTMLATKSPQVRQWTIEKSGSASTPESVFMAEMSGLDYERRGKEDCLANAIQEGNLLADRLEPAGLLHFVLGAQEAGSEKVNAIAANHYTFDQHALGEDGLTQATGEMWVASDGGYLVKYLLTRKAKSDYFGQGVEGTLTLDYELTDPNKPVTIELPDDCPPGMVDAPLLPDATNVVKTPGRLTYETSSSVADAAAFYQKQIPDQGWKLDGDPAITDATAFLNYKRGTQDMIIFITAKDGKTTVKISVGRSQE